MQSITLELTDEAAEILARSKANGTFAEIITAINHTILENKVYDDYDDAQIAGIEALLEEAEEDFANGRYTVYNSAAEFGEYMSKVLKESEDETN